MLTIRMRLEGKHDGPPVLIDIEDVVGLEWDEIVDLDAGETLNAWIEALYYDEIRLAVWEEAVGGEFATHRN